MADGTQVTRPELDSVERWIAQRLDAQRLSIERQNTEMAQLQESQTEVANELREILSNVQAELKVQTALHLANQDRLNRIVTGAISVIVILIAAAATTILFGPAGG